MLMLRADRMFDGERFSNGPMTVLVEDGRIVGVEEGMPDVPDGWRVLDHPGGTVLPGLIDSHVHLVTDSGEGALDRVGAAGDEPHPGAVHLPAECHDERAHRLGGDPALLHHGPDLRRCLRSERRHRGCTQRATDEDPAAHQAVQHLVGGHRACRGQATAMLDAVEQAIQVGVENWQPMTSVPTVFIPPLAITLTMSTPRSIRSSTAAMIASAPDTSPPM